MRIPFFSVLLTIACISTWKAGSASANSDNGGGPVRKRLISAGWDSPDPETLFNHREAIEKSPFSGVRIQIGPRRGPEVTFRRIFSPSPWKREMFERDLEFLRKARSPRLPDHFLAMGPGAGMDWFDDEGWKNVAEHFRIAAWLAREGGLKGIMFDPEIGTSDPPFSYLRQKEKKPESFEAYAAKARQRGREVMKALREVYPEMTIFTLFLNSGRALGALGTDPREGLKEGRNYSLYPAFVNGWLDEMPPSMTIVDGAEYAYPHSSELQYLKHVNAMRNTTIALIAPENRMKYRAQVQAGLAVYLDAYIRHPKSNVHSDVLLDPPLAPGERVVDRLQATLTAAQEVSDEYVWVWGEHYRWWPTKTEQVAPRTWEEVLPGITRALERAIDPQWASLARAEKEFAIKERKLALRGGEHRQLLLHGDFASLEKGESSPWASVPPSDEAFLESWTGAAGPGSARLGPGQSLEQEADIAPYTFYKLRAQVRQVGEGKPVIRLRWKGDHEAPPPGSPEVKASPRDGWQPMETIFRAPGGVSRLVVTLAMEGGGPGDQVWLDDVELIPISVN